VGLFKRKCVKNNPYSLDELKQNIQDFILNFTTENLRKFASNMRKRVDACIAEHGGYLKHLL
jgi:tRNA G37 N-methylase TrmD